MDTKTLLETLSEVANSLDEKNHYKQADRITDLMVRVSQMPVPVKPQAYTPNNPLKNLGNALLGGVKSLGKAYNEAWDNFGGEKVQGVKDIRMPDIRMPELPHVKIERDLKQNAQHQQERYIVNDFIARHVNSIHTALKSNPNYDVAQARMDMKSNAMRDPVFLKASEYSKKHYNFDLMSSLVTNFSLYVLNDPEIRIRLKKQHGDGAYFDESGRVQSRKVNVPPFYKYNN